MKLYEIDDQIERILAREVDQETGEITDEVLEKLGKLELDKKAKALAVAAYILGEYAEAELVGAHAKPFLDRAKEHVARAKAHKGRADRLKEYLQHHLTGGEKISDERVRIGWRPSEIVVVNEDLLDPDPKWWRKEPNKSAIKEALKAGEEVPGAVLRKPSHIQIK